MKTVHEFILFLFQSDRFSPFTHFRFNRFSFGVSRIPSAAHKTIQFQNRFHSLKELNWIGEKEKENLKGKNMAGEKEQLNDFNTRSTESYCYRLTMVQ